jgi:hypothetical protein
MRIPLPLPKDLAAQPVLGAIGILEVALVLTADALRSGLDPTWAHPHSEDEDENSITARVLAQECHHLRRLLAAHRRRLRAHLRRAQSLDSLF